MTVPGAATAVCFRHPDRPTGLRCTRCGRPACPECLREASVGFHCVACLAESRAQAPTVVNAAGVPTSGAPATPVVTYGLIGANVLVFLLTVVAPGGGLLDDQFSGVVQRFALSPVLVAQGQWWDVVTSGFLHFGLLHVAVNMVSLLILGRDLEGVLGSARFAAVYGVALLGGSAGVLLLADVGTLTAGASGAIFGLLGAVAVVLLKLRRSPRPVFTVIALNVVISVAVPGISLWAHLGGLVAGAAATAAVVHAPAARRALAQWSGLAGVAVLALVVSAVAVLRIRAQYGL